MAISYIVDKLLTDFTAAFVIFTNFVVEWYKNFTFVPKAAL